MGNRAIKGSIIVPQGAQGVQGTTGSQGAHGTTGNTGAQGTQGVQGATGNTGVQGVRGYQGLKGNTGNTGAQGVQGAAGNTGAQGVRGYQGYQGLKGNTGNTGAQGVQGYQGVSGLATLYNGIRDGQTGTAPTENAVYDALAIKASLAIDDTAPAGDEAFWYNPSKGELLLRLDSTWVSPTKNGVDGAAGVDGALGLGWTGGSYNAGNGVVTFTSADGLGFSTSDLRGEDGADGTNGTNGEDGNDGVAIVTFIQATGNTSSANIFNLEVNLIWNTPEFTDPAISIADEDITINTTAKYKFTVTFMTLGDNRIESILKTYIDTGGGYVVKPNAIARNYASRDSDQSRGSVTLTYILSLTAADVVKFTAKANADGTAILQDDGTVLIIEKLT